MRDSARRRGRLVRDADEGMLAGVCAGIARHLGLRPRTVRIATLVLLVLFTVPTVVAYALMAWLAPSERSGGYRARPAFEAGKDDADADTDSDGNAVDGLARLKNRFRRLEEKFADVEAQMMGGEGRDRP
jgi:phage shock protein C